jgi:hypothetical protein
VHQAVFVRPERTAPSCRHFAMRRHGRKRLDLWPPFQMLTEFRGEIATFECASIKQREKLAQWSAAISAPSVNTDKPSTIELCVKLPARDYRDE